MDNQEKENVRKEYSRWAKNADQPPIANQKPRPLTDFLEDSSDLFTIIGVFATVSFYLIQFEGIPIEKIQAGIVGSLIIFVIVGLSAINRAIDEASCALEVGSAYLTATYAILATCLMGLLFTVYQALDHQAPSIDPALATFASIAIGIFYAVGVLVNADYRHHDGWWVSELIIYYSPYLGALLGGYWVKTSEAENGQTIIEAADGNVLALTLALVLIHLISTLVIVLIAETGDGIPDYLQEVLTRLKDGLRIG